MTETTLISLDTFITDMRHILHSNPTSSLGRIGAVERQQPIITGTRQGNRLEIIMNPIDPTPISNEVFRDDINETRGIIKYYSIHGGLDLQDYVKYYCLSVLNTTLDKLNPISSIYQTKIEYIKHQLQFTPCSEYLDILKPELQEYHCSSIFPFRDQIIHTQVVRIIGEAILDLQTISGKKVHQQIGQYLRNNNHQYQYIKEEELERIIRNAWRVITSLHEIGRYFIESDKPSSYDDDVFNAAHGIKNCIKIDNLGPIDNRKVIKLAQGAFLYEDYLDENEIIDKNSKLYSRDSWEEEPLGHLFSVAIILGEFALRTCWSCIDEKDPHEHTYLPVNKVILNRDNCQLLYTPTLKEFPQGTEPHKEGPIPQDRLEYLKIAFGKNFLFLFSQKDVKNLEAKWDLNQGQLPSIPTDIPEKKTKAKHMSGIDSEKIKINGVIDERTIVPHTEVQGLIDYAIITIRDDENQAVSDRIDTSKIVPYGSRYFPYGIVKNDNGKEIHIINVQTSEKGQQEALALTISLVDAVKPKAVILSGIAGGVPSEDYTLGDVLIASHVQDFSISAYKPNRLEFSSKGFEIHPKVKNLISNLRSIEDCLGDWGSREAVGLDTPNTPINIEDFYSASDSWNKKAFDKVSRCFHQDGARIRSSRFFHGEYGSSNSLIQNPDILKIWEKTSRDISTVEMELAGVCKGIQEKTVPNKYFPLLISVRGISDIVGLKRHLEWTEYACQIPASFANSFIRSSVIYELLFTDY